MINFAITTKFLPATDVKGARIKATIHDFDNVKTSATISYPHHVAASDTHLEAALTLVRELEISGDLIEARLPDGFVFILTNVRKNDV
jgi:hypothetical protein